MSRTGTLGPEYRVSPQTCKSNYCPTCRIQQLRQLRFSLRSALKRSRCRLVTLTWPDHTLDPLHTLKLITRAFRGLTKRLRESYPKAIYVRTIELHETGVPHLHCIFNQYIPLSWLQLHWNRLGGGIVDITLGQKCRKCGKKPPCEHEPKKRPPFSYKDAARYLTNEIEKRTQDPHHLGLTFWLARLRTISTSRDLKINPYKSDWSYLTLCNNLEEADYYYQLLQFNATYSNRPQPTIADTPYAIYYGPAYVH